MDERTPTVDELIEMLEIIKNQIKPHLSPRRKTTLIVDVYPESTKFVLTETIDYLKESKESVEHEKNPYTV